MPFWLLYGASNCLYYLLFYVIRYRRKVVRENLQGAFPNKTAKEIYDLECRFYRHLCDIVLEGLKGFTLSKKQILRRYIIRDVHIVDDFYKAGRSVLVAGSHCANWEWGAIGTVLQIAHPVVILFQPIKNKYINNYLKNSREKYQTYLRAIAKTQAAFKEFYPQPYLYIFVADQNPSNPRTAHWVDFFGRDTAWLRGSASYAQLYDLPLVFINTRRVGRGYYEVTPELITETPTKFTPLELTEMYVRRLEKLILENPAHWLWSHRRWKHRRTKEGANVE